jgi:hypothetical protein
LHESYDARALTVSCALAIRGCRAEM